MLLPCRVHLSRSSNDRSPVPRICLACSYSCGQLQRGCPTSTCTLQCQQCRFIPIIRRFCGPNSIFCREATNSYRPQNIQTSLLRQMSSLLLLQGYVLEVRIHSISPPEDAASTSSNYAEAHPSSIIHETPVTREKMDILRHNNLHDPKCIAYGEANLGSFSALSGR